MPDTMAAMAKPLSTRPVVRRSQQARRDDTQRRLLEATLHCLVCLGYARSTTTEIVRAAGVSQGALFKYYPTKAALMSAAVAYLFEDLVRAYRADFETLPKGKDAVERGFELLWRIYTGPRLTAAFELYLAARTDRELSAQLWPVVREHRVALVTQARTLFPEAARDNPAFDAFIDLLMCSMGGIVLEQYGAGDIGTSALATLKGVVLSAISKSAAGTPVRLKPARSRERAARGA
jgi:AcrR family transcriptional regulator